MNRTILLLTLMAFALCACNAHAAERTKKWTLLIFINADNNLDGAGVDDVTEMEKVGSTDDVNIITMLDREGSGGTKTYYVEKEPGYGIQSPVIQDLPEQDMGDYNTLVDFFKFGVDNYPAEKYLVAIWNHGAGWQKNAAHQLIKGISYDDQSHNHMTTPQLGLACKMMSEYIGRKIDIISYDACLMQMAEVAAEVKDYGLVQVGAEETEPGDGWPYDDFCAPLVASPDMDAKELGTVMVDTYCASYNGGSQGSRNTNQSALDLTKFDAFLTKLDAFSVAMNENAHLTAIYKQAFGKTQAFYYSQYKDLGDYIKELCLLTDNAAVKAAGTELKNFIDNEVVIRNGYVGSNLAESTGISIYIPTKSQLNDNIEAYRELKFAEACHWDEFLQGVYFPNVPVISVKAVDVIEESDGAVNPGDTVKLVVRLENEGMKPGLNLTVAADVAGDAEVLGNAVVVDQVPALSTVDAPVIEVKIGDNCPIDTKLAVNISVTDADGNVINGSTEIFVKELFEVNNNVLLVVTDKTDDLTPLYKKALADAGIGYDLYDLSYFGGATLPLLKNYLNGVVIFNAPGSGEAKKIDRGVLASYLDLGGNFFMTGQDVGYALKSEAFYKDYLHATYIQDNTGIHTINGMDMQFSITGGDGANNQKWPDEIDPIAPAQAIFTYEGAKIEELANTERVDNTKGINGTGTAGLFVNTGTYKVVYFSFGFEAISTAADRAAVMGKTVAMLMPTVDERIASLKTFATRNRALINGGMAAQATAQRAEQHWLDLSAKLVKPADLKKVKAAGLRQLLRRCGGDCGDCGDGDNGDDDDDCGDGGCPLPEGK